MNFRDLESTAPEPPEAPAPNGRPAAVPALAFQGATACGMVGLSMAPEADAAEPFTGSAQVLRLAQAEGLIRAVEDWLRSAWDPAPAPADAPLPAYCATVRDPALAPPGTQLRVAADALRMPPPPALRSPALVWAAVEAEMVLAQVPDDAIARLEPGALLWLPAAFGTAWAVSLRDASGRLPACPARLDLRAQRLSVAAADGAQAHAGASAPDAAADRGSARLEVRLERRIQVPLDHWLGWGRADAPFHWPVPQPWVAQLQQGDTWLAGGALMPLGQGCGLRVDTLAQPLADAAA